MCKTEPQNKEEKSVQTNGNGEDEVFYKLLYKCNDALYVHYSST